MLIVATDVNMAPTKGDVLLRALTVYLNVSFIQGCVLSPLLYSLFTHDCTALSDRTLVVKFADDTTVTGFISNNDETSYRRQVNDLVNWCVQNDLLLNVDKTKEMTVVFGRNFNVKEPLSVDGEIVQRIDTLIFSVCTLLLT